MNVARRGVHELDLDRLGSIGSLVRRVQQHLQTTASTAAVSACASATVQEHVHLPLGLQATLRTRDTWPEGV